jgi:hypothetical protein
MKTWFLTSLNNGRLADLGPLLTRGTVIDWIAVPFLLILIVCYGAMPPTIPLSKANFETIRLKLIGGQSNHTNHQPRG